MNSSKCHFLGFMELTSRIKSPTTTKSKVNMAECRDCLLLLCTVEIVVVFNSYKSTQRGKVAGEQI